MKHVQVGPTVRSHHLAHLANEQDPLELRQNNVRFKWAPFNHSKKVQCSAKEEPPLPKKDKIQGQHDLSRYLKDSYQKYQNELMAN